MGRNMSVGVGTRHKTKGFGDVEVLTYKNCDTIEVRFDTDGRTKWVTGGNLRKGEVKNNYQPSVFGVGYIGEGSFRCNLIGGYNGVYSVWAGILRRCYRPYTGKELSIYSGCSVSEEWHNFQNFAEWYVKRHSGVKVAVDKDLLEIGNKVYSPDKCILVPQWLNNFTLTSNKSRGGCAVGVNLIKSSGRYRAYCLRDGVIRHLGTFLTEPEAYNAWKSFKLEIAASRKQDMDSIDERIYPNVVTLINSTK